MHYQNYQSPLGLILLVGHNEQLHSLTLPTQRPADWPLPQWTHSKTAYNGCARQLDEYFEGKRQSFSLDLAPQGTLFQRRVWDALVKIPYGETRSYRDIATVLGNAKAVRAVGGANGKNPIAIVIPCHRVIGANGQLTGYAGGLHYKRSLLNLEHHHVRP